MEFSDEAETAETEETQAAKIETEDMFEDSGKIVIACFSHRDILSGITINYMMMSVSLVFTGIACSVPAADPWGCWHIAKNDKREVEKISPQ